MASLNKEELHSRRPKHFVNDPNKIVLESLRGLCLSYPSLRFIEKEKIVYRADIDDIRKKQVTLISGGGAGHEPTHAAFVGPKLLSAAVSGNIFASPSTSQILAAIRRVQSPHGTLLIVKNYTGDCLNFGLAAERAKAEGIKVGIIIVGDDVGVGRKQGGLVGRRGLAGTIFVHKVAGALAAKGASLEEVKNAALLIAENVGTIGVAFDRCTIPGTTQGSSLPDDVIELGMGIHGEPGFQKIPLPPSSELVQKMLDTIINTQDADRSFLDISPEEDQIALLVNNLGGVSTLELGVVINDAFNYLVKKNFYVKRIYVGHFMTSLNMPGVSLSILKLPKNLDAVSLLDIKAEAPGWINHVKVDISNLNTNLDEKVSHSNIKENEEKLFVVNVNPQLFESAIKAGCNALIQAEPEITKYDTIVGDGDCGVTLKYGAIDILTALENDQIITNDLSGGLMKISRILDARGGTSGFLYCLFINAISNNLRYFVNTKMKKDDEKDQIIVDGECLGASLKSALSTLQTYTPARKGDRTMMDAIIPFITTFTDTLCSTNNNTLSAFKDAIEAARIGAESTKGMKPKLGRSTYIADNIIQEAQVPDPGAWAAYVILNGIYGSLSNL